MVVKELRGRKRYILFTVKGTNKKEIINLVNESDLKLRLIFYNKEYGIVRCPHFDKDKTIAFLQTIKINNCPIQTLKTSGTIKKLKREISSIGFSESKPH
jgi:RNase P/RNase MRP subunit POP5